MAKQEEANFNRGIFFTLFERFVAAQERQAAANEDIASTQRDLLVCSRESVNVQKRLARNSELMEQMLASQNKDA